MPHDVQAWRMANAFTVGNQRLAGRIESDRVIGVQEHREPSVVGVRRREVWHPDGARVLLRQVDVHRTLVKDGHTVAVVRLQGLDPVARCRQVWAEGGFGQGRRVPPLIACVYPSGAVAVIPGKDEREYDEAGFRRPAAGQIDKLMRFEALEDAIRDRLKAVPGGCPTTEVATEIVTSELRARGFTGWTVTVSDVKGPWAPDGCATFGRFHEDRRVAELFRG
jgi:hypothetical protein